MAKPNRQTIGRTLTLSFCVGVNIIEGEIRDFYEVLPGDYTPERATKKLRRLNEDQSITINEVRTETGYFVMDLLEFAKNAKVTLK